MFRPYLTLVTSSAIRLHASLAEGSRKQTVILKQNKTWGFHGGKNHVLVFQAMIPYSMAGGSQTFRGTKT